MSVLGVLGVDGHRFSYFTDADGIPDEYLRRSGYIWQSGFTASEIVKQYILKIEGERHGRDGFQRGL